MSIATKARVGAGTAAIAAALLAGPAFAQADGQPGARTDSDHPVIPGYTQPNDLDVPAKGPPSVAREAQQANRLPDEPQLAAVDGGWAEREEFVRSAGEAVDFWQAKVEGIDPETIRLEDLKARLEELETQHDQLENAQSGSWERDRDAFQAVLLAMREQYAELPQGRKSDPASKEPDEGGAAPADTDAVTD